MLHTLIDIYIHIRMYLHTQAYSMEALHDRLARECVL